MWFDFRFRSFVLVRISSFGFRISRRGKMPCKNTINAHASLAASPHRTAIRPASIAEARPAARIRRRKFAHFHAGRRRTRSACFAMLKRRQRRLQLAGKLLGAGLIPQLAKLFIVVRVLRVPIHRCPAALVERLAQTRFRNIRWHGASPKMQYPASFILLGRLHFNVNEPASHRIG